MQGELRGGRVVSKLCKASCVAAEVVSKLCKASCVAAEVTSASHLLSFTQFEGAGRRTGASCTD